MLELLYLPVSSAIFAIVWVYALTEPGAIFGWWPKVSNNIYRENWFIKLSYGCAKCLAGQLCLWRCLFSGSYSIYDSTIYIAFWQVIIAILIALVYEKIFD